METYPFSDDSGYGNIVVVYVFSGGNLVSINPVKYYLVKQQKGV